jgi:hypothetical protein
VFTATCIGIAFTPNPAATNATSGSIPLIVETRNLRYTTCCLPRVPSVGLSSMISGRNEQK